MNCLNDSRIIRQRLRFKSWQKNLKSTAAKLFYRACLMNISVIASYCLYQYITPCWFYYHFPTILLPFYYRFITILVPFSYHFTNHSKYYIIYESLCVRGFCLNKIHYHAVCISKYITNPSMIAVCLPSRLSTLDIFPRVYL